ncbi:hypothetical protein [Methylobacter sp. BlB1]|uniref:hypothetical protein n=1 Tax=Methylobacter sp. BlB1 TaxID=2785914 RepID=UPI001895FFA1|nr:hypothetical protein [Methylobacter sp. BlB1]MBF6649363.1 hypothetical protein [Methylobacter sp. BlB1]
MTSLSTDFVDNWPFVFSKQRRPANPVTDWLVYAARAISMNVGGFAVFSGDGSQLEPLSRAIQSNAN